MKMFDVILRWLVDPEKLPWRIEWIIRKQFSIKRLHVKFEWRSRKSGMGRFGGGWQWMLGFRASGWHRGSWTFVLHLLVADVVVEWEAKK